MIAQEGRPSLCRLRATRRSPHPAQDSSLGNIEAKHEQFTVDAGSTASWVLGNHTEDKLAQFYADTFSAYATPMQREPSPIRFESGTVPANNCLRLDENQRPLPPRPEAPQCHPEESVSSSKSWLRMSSIQDRKLLSSEFALEETLDWEGMFSDHGSSRGAVGNGPRKIEEKS